MKDCRAILKKAAKQMDEALQRYENGEDTLTVAKRVRRVRRVVAEAGSALIRERVEAILAKPTLDRKDKETLEELLMAMIQNRSHH